MTEEKIAAGAVTDAKISGPISGTKIATVGLNADQLDGLHASSFAFASHIHEDLQGQVAALEAIVATLQAQLSSQGVALAALQDRVGTVESNTALQLNGLVHVQLSEFNGASGPNVIVDGANLHVTNGSGMTEGTANGIGNLIVGYNESRYPVTPPDNRTGSHNIIVGSRQNYSSYGGFVAGWYNQMYRPRFLGQPVECIHAA